MQIYYATLCYTNYTTLHSLHLITSNYANNYNNNYYHNYNYKYKYNYTTLH